MIIVHQKFGITLFFCAALLFSFSASTVTATSKALRHLVGAGRAFHTNQNMREALGAATWAEVLGEATQLGSSVVNNAIVSRRVAPPPAAAPKVTVALRAVPPVTERFCPDHSTPLMAAARDGDIAAVRRLVNDGTNVDATDRLGYTALYYAVSTGNKEIGEALILAGAEIDLAGTTGVRQTLGAWAKRYGQEKLAEELEALYRTLREMVV